MEKSTYKEKDSISSDSQFPIEKINKILADKETDALRKILKTLSTRYDISSQDLTKITDENITIPLSIYSDKNLSMLESTVKYLKEELNMRYSKIGRLLKRDERTIWVTYHNSLKKSNKKTIISDGISIPIKIFSKRRFGILESAVGFLKEDHGLKFSEIARILRKDDRTIWTCYKRLKDKKEQENEAS